MHSSRNRAITAASCHSSERARFTGPLARGLVEAVPGAKDPVEAILYHARLLLIESGMQLPPFAPSSYATLRNVRSIVEIDLNIDGRLVPVGNEFVIELRKNRSRQRKNFTCAHEIAHTFFYESVPSIKYRQAKTTDSEEEALCNIAAAELLMPSKVFRTMADCYSPSATALLDIAATFDTSLSATAIRIASETDWPTTFILWNQGDNGLVAAWIVQPQRGLRYKPRINLLDLSSSGVYRAFTTGEPAHQREFLLTDSGVRPCNGESIRLPNGSILTCLRSGTSAELPSRQLDSSAQPILPIDYKCECHGSGWRVTRVQGRETASRCRAVNHLP